MNETNLDWDDFRLFLSVAREGGLSAAALITGKSAPTLGRRMLALEQRLGQQLFNRMPRGYVLTEQGEQLLTKVLSLEASIQPIDSVAHHTIPRVKISAGTWVSQLLCSKADELTGPLPVLLQFTSADHILDIGHREAIIGIRNKRPEQITLAGRPIGKVQFATYAANDSISTWARVVGSTPSASWVQRNASTDDCIDVTSPRNAYDLAISGIARAVLPTFIGDTAAELKKVSDDIEDLEHMQWLVTHHEDRHLPEVRQVIDLVYTTLKSSITGGK